MFNYSFSCSCIFVPESMLKYHVILYWFPPQTNTTNKVFGNYINLQILNFIPKGVHINQICSLNIKRDYLTLSQLVLYPNRPKKRS